MRNVTLHFESVTIYRALDISRLPLAGREVHRCSCSAWKMMDALEQPPVDANHDGLV